MTRRDDLWELLHAAGLYSRGGKRMKKLAVAAVVTARCGAAASPQQAARPRGPQTASSAPKLAASHTPDAISVDAQNQLVAQNCASCHSERMKAGQLVLAGFDAAK